MMRQSVGLRFLEQSQDLLPLHTWEPFEKFFDRIAAFQVIKETLYRYPGSRKDRLSSEDFWVSHHYFSHRKIIRHRQIFARQSCVAVRLFFFVPFLWIVLFAISALLRRSL